MIVSENSSARDEDVEKLVRVAGVAKPPAQTCQPCLTLDGHCLKMLYKAKYFNLSQ